MTCKFSIHILWKEEYFRDFSYARRALHDNLERAQGVRHCDFYPQVIHRGARVCLRRPRVAFGRNRGVVQDDGA